MKILDEFKVNERLNIKTIERNINGQVFLFHVAIHRNFDGKSTVSLAVTKPDEKTSRTGKKTQP